MAGPGVHAAPRKPISVAGPSQLLCRKNMGLESASPGFESDSACWGLGSAAKPLLASVSSFEGRILLPR